MKVAFRLAATTAFAASALAVAAPANAAVIMGLYDTGVNNAGLVLAPGAIEQHYKITASNVSTNGNTNIPFQSVMRTPFVTTYSQWSADSPVGSGGSAWITQRINANATPAKSGPNKPSGTPSGANRYDYDLTFNLGSLSPSSAMITGMLQADNFAQVYLNGNLVGGQTPVNAPGIPNYFRRFTAFGANAGFVNGLNTIRFSVYDYGSVSGLRVSDLMGTAVPEPATWAMMILGFGAVASQARRRRRGASVLA
jgi:PEP-CTERM motif